MQVAQQKPQRQPDLAVHVRNLQNRQGYWCQSESDTLEGVWGKLLMVLRVV